MGPNTPKMDKRRKEIKRERKTKTGRERGERRGREEKNKRKKREGKKRGVTVSCQCEPSQQWGGGMHALVPGSPQGALRMEMTTQGLRMNTITKKKVQTVERRGS